jgi:hypothetical protein
LVDDEMLYTQGKRKNKGKYDNQLHVVSFFC